jgi:exosortase A-associated hydrolase 2
LREVFFIRSGRGRRFAVVCRPEREAIGALLFVHPFAEELNRSRRMIALAANGFARQGWLVLQVDQFGCGDSEGEFGEARWQDWLDDISVAWRWLDSHAPRGPRVLWTLRSGSLLAGDWMRATGLEAPLLMWQPVLSGRQCLTQFLRLNLSAALLDATLSRQTIAQLRQRLAAGETLEIIGYALNSDLAAALDAVVMTLPPGYREWVLALEVISPDADGASVGSVRFARGLREQGRRVLLRSVQGVPFWETPEVETVPTLIDASCDALELMGCHV